MTFNLNTDNKKTGKKTVKELAKTLNIDLSLNSPQMQKQISDHYLANDILCKSKKLTKTTKDVKKTSDDKNKS